MEDMVFLARETEEKSLNTRVEADVFWPSALGCLRGRLEEISVETEEMQEGQCWYIRKAEDIRIPLCETECEAPFEKQEIVNRLKVQN